MQDASQLADNANTLPEWFVDKMIAEAVANSSKEGRRRERRKAKPAQGVEYHPPQEARSGQPVGGTSNDSEALAVRPGDLASCHSEVCGLPTSCAVVGVRVDWLTVALRVRLRERFLSDLRAALQAAPDALRVAFKFGGQSWELRDRRSGGFILRNADGVLVVDPDAVGEWTLQAELSGSIMMVTTWDAATERIRRWARSAGMLRGERVRRLDLCADIAGFSVGDIERLGLRWLRPSRARVAKASIEDIAGKRVTRYERGREVTGYTVCPGNDIQAVVYDKREELTIRTEKSEAEQERWRSRGWDGVAPVTRVEFRLKTRALDELKARDGLDRCGESLDRIWQYAARKWLRLVAPGEGRSRTASVVPAWDAVQWAKFTHWATPGVRRRLRAGAAPAQAFGASLSTVAAAQRLPAVVLPWGEVLDCDDPPVCSTDREAESVLRAIIAATMRATEDPIAEDMLERMGAKRAAIFAVQRYGAARARFSSAAEPDETRAA